MSASVQPKLPPLATGVRVDDEKIRVFLADGREVAVPLAWFPRLQAATPAQRNTWELIGRGVGIHWESVDEDISVPWLFGQPDL
jgi:Protein of unknown function (DUF2442)